MYSVLELIFMKFWNIKNSYILNIKYRRDMSVEISLGVNPLDYYKFSYFKHLLVMSAIFSHLKAIDKTENCLNGGQEWNIG